MVDTLGTKTGPEILKVGEELHSMNALSQLQIGQHMITRKQIEDLIVILSLHEYRYADPAIRELRSLPKLADYELED